MKEYLAKKYIFTVLFIAFIMFATAVNIKNTYKTLYDESKEIINKNNNKDIGSMMDTADNLMKSWDLCVNENVYDRFKYLELYGFYNKVLGKNEYNGFKLVTDKDGYINYANFWNFTFKDQIPTRDLAERVYNLEQKVAEKGTKVYVLGMPVRTMAEYVDYDKGMPCQDFSEVADDYLYHCNTFNLEVIDFRTTIKSSSLSKTDLFYKTDHHWSVTAAFLAFQDLVSELKKDGINLDPIDFYTDINNYDVKTYEKCWLGTFGVKTGLNYVGEMEDYTTIKPKFDTMFKYSFKWRSSEEIFTREGKFDETLFIESNVTMQLDGDLYESTAYNTYLNGACEHDSITNLNNPDGPKVLFIRDSYSSPLGAFFANVCSQVDMIWSIEYKGNIEELVENRDYDIIFVATWPENISEEAFNFYKNLTSTEK